MFAQSVEKDNPVSRLLERISPGSSDRFVITLDDKRNSYFSLSDVGDGRVLIKADSYLSAATGLNWYLKYYCGIHLSWGNMEATLPVALPPVGDVVEYSSSVPLRYYLNYCTFSYSMPFWDEERWREETDFMALHGINLCLMTLGTDAVWTHFLKNEGLEATGFVADPAHEAWHLMNNLEGYGGPNSSRWLDHSLNLAKKVILMMNEWGIEPMLPGFSGMMPHDSWNILGFHSYDMGMWCGLQRPCLIDPNDPVFRKLASRYYALQSQMLGVKARYFSMDPGHEGSLSGLDKTTLSRVIAEAMTDFNPEAIWTLQAWGANPDPEIIRSVPSEHLLILDLSSPAVPQWGDPSYAGTRPKGFEGRNWIWCMLLNYGGNEGLFGRISNVIRGFYDAQKSPLGKGLSGIGLTPEGIENNPMMYELAMELPWRPDRFSPYEWIHTYSLARYGIYEPDIERAWNILISTIYDCPNPQQQGTSESIFCSRPSLNVTGASSWSQMKQYYDADSVILAAKYFANVADRFRNNDRYIHDLVDITRQAVAEAGRLSYYRMVEAVQKKDLKTFEAEAKTFLSLLLSQDKLLGTRKEFRLGHFLAYPLKLDLSLTEQQKHITSLKRLLTTWGDRAASEEGGLRDYAHREWHGLLKDFYFPRWQKWIISVSESLKNGSEISVDNWFEFEDDWVTRPSYYSPEPEGETIETVKEIMEIL